MCHCHVIHWYNVLLNAYSNCTNTQKGKTVMMEHFSIHPRYFNKALSQ